MKVLHLAAGNRWTGAAAPAFAEVEALREGGIEAHYAYVGGYKLEAKIGQLDFTHAVIERAQNPAAFRRSVRTIRRLVDEHQFDFLHAHLTYDHWLARFAARRSRALIARTFHSRRVLRADPLTQLLMRRTRAVFVINDSFRDAAAIRHRNPLFTPPPVDHRRFHADGPNVRASYGVESSAKLITVIGKLSKGRGFELALETFAEIRKSIARSRLMIIGHGEHRPALQNHASQLGLSADVIWAGYHEEDLADHYRASDVLLFTARGSDEGHRAVLEAMACGVPPVTAPLEGIEPLVGDLDLVAAEGTAGTIAQRAIAVLTRSDLQLRGELARHSRQFGYSAAAARLIAAYKSVI